MKKSKFTDEQKAYALQQVEGGRSAGMERHGAPVVTIQRRPLKTSRSERTGRGASSVINVRYGATRLHSLSLTSLG